MEKKLKHMEFVQSVIDRMSKHSFLLKGWCITLVVSLLAFADKKADPRYIIIAYFAVLVLWFLDGYYLSRERMFRNLYNNIRIKDENEIDFSMSISDFCCGNNTWIKSTFSGTLIVFYLSNMIVMLLIAYLFQK